MTAPETGKEAWTILVDDAGQDAMGRVLASPEAYTLLGRLKAIADSASSLSGSEGWRAVKQSDTGASDSDKSFTVTTGKEWQLISIWIELTTNGTAGNRQMTIQLQDSTGDIIGTIKADVAQAASLTRNYQFGVGMPNDTSFLDTSYLRTPLIPIILPAAYKIRVYDSAAVAAAGDTMIVHMMLMERTV